nr:uncharacterized protein LOC113814860 [Penaeus vannamei]
MHLCMYPQHVHIKPQDKNRNFHGLNFRINSVDHPSSFPSTPPFLFLPQIGVEKCDPQDERFALIYTVTVCCYSIPGILVGYLLHHAGLRVTRVSGGTMLSLGFLFLGIATKGLLDDISERRISFVGHVARNEGLAYD